VISLAMFGLHARRPVASPARAASPLGMTTLLAADSLAELSGVVLGLVIACCAALVADHLLGSFQRLATLDPITIVVASLLAVVVVPSLRAAVRAALRGPLNVVPGP
jgi:hypothetical protein